MKYVFWLEPVKRDGTRQVQPRYVTIERAILMAKERKDFDTDDEALDWFVEQKEGRLVK